MNTFDEIDMNNKNDFTSIIKSIENDLYNIAKNKIRNTNDIEDIIQETVIKIYKNHKNLRNPKLFKAWAVKILINECNKSYKKKYKDMLLLRKIASKTAISPDDHSIEDCESKMRFKELLKTLPKTDRDIFFFYYQCHYSTKEISAILNINENTIKSKIKRNKEKIKKIMKGGNDENEKQ